MFNETNIFENLEHFASITLTCERVYTLGVDLIYFKYITRNFSNEYSAHVY